MKTAFIILISLGLATASCPNGCSGHGTCDSTDQCTCYNEFSKSEFKPASTPTDMEWTGADCSLRTCPRGISWTKGGEASAGTICGHKVEQECSDQGVCDRSTGSCTCFDGYEGSACQRTSCPNDCSGHGTCRSNTDFAYDFSQAKANQLQGTSDDLPTYASTYLATYNNAWDSNMHMGCKCDQGYRGPDCSKIECPSTDDPLDEKCKVYRTAGATVSDLQLQFDVAVGTAAYKNAYNANYPAGPNKGKSINEYQIADAVQKIDRIFGCFGATSGQDCSGRGLCDYTSGTCQCFSGYSGSACEKVSEVA